MPSKCVCKGQLSVRKIKTMEGEVELTLCPRCDILKCPSCKKPAHDYFKVGASKCWHCGVSFPVVSK